MLLLTYVGHKNSYIEEQVETVSKGYNGLVIGDFKFEYGGFSVTVNFPTKDQETAFKREIARIAKVMNIKIEFGGSF